MESIIRRGETYLKPAIAQVKTYYPISFFTDLPFFQYFKTVLIVDETDSLPLHSKIYYVFDELCHISESIGNALIPSIEHRLTVREEVGEINQLN